MLSNEYRSIYPFMVLLEGGFGLFKANIRT
jgi:hypothetical protein